MNRYVLVFSFAKLFLNVYESFSEIEAET